MIQVQTSEEFSRLLEALADDIVSANIHWKHADDIDAALNEHPLVWAQSQTFWYLTLKSNRYTALQCLCRAYDQNQSSLHLLSWLKTIQANTHLFSQSEFRKRLAGNPFVDSLAEDPRTPDLVLLKEDIESCSMKDPDVHLLIQYRSNLLAHRNAKTTTTGAASNGRFALPGTNICTLLERAHVILNRYSYLFGATTHSVKMLGHDDYKFIFNSVQSAVEKLRDDG